REREEESLFPPRRELRFLILWFNFFYTSPHAYKGLCLFFSKVIVVQPRLCDSVDGFVIVINHICVTVYCFRTLEYSYFK
ncbi:hypothetical protein RYX36_004489, partial [Vicia faba]